ncbi:MAG: PIN domain-containing protein [Pyrinomonadaceae bacterium]
MGRLDFPYGSRLYFDTAPIIYSVEKHPVYWPLLETLWAISNAEKFHLVTSELTILETLVQPIRNGNTDLAAAYKEFLSGDDFYLIPISTEVLRTAAELRANHNLKTPDAIHAASAISSGCEYLIANDNGFKRLSDIDVIILNDLR